jgi:hypothetical protein
MHDSEALTRLLDAWQRTLAFVRAEARRDPAFAERLAQALADVPLPPPDTTERPVRPDLFAEWGARGADGFRAWLAKQPPDQLRTLIRSYKLDPAKKTSGWRDAIQLAEFIVERVAQRMQQGQVFLQQN